MALAWRIVFAGTIFSSGYKAFGARVRMLSVGAAPTVGLSFAEAEGVSTCAIKSECVHWCLPESCSWIVEMLAAVQV